MLKSRPGLALAGAILLAGVAIGFPYELVFSQVPNPIPTTANPDAPFGYYLSRDDAFTEGEIEMEQSDGAACVFVRRIADDNWQLGRC